MVDVGNVLYREILICNRLHHITKLNENAYLTVLGVR